MARALALASAAVVLSLAPAARARDDDERLRLRWSAPAGCPSADAVEKAALAHAGPRPPSAAVLQADARVERTGRGFRLTLRTHEGKNEGERQLDSVSCADAADAAAVLLALALVPPDPAASAPAPAPAPAPIPPPEAAPPPPAPAPAPAAASPVTPTPTPTPSPTPAEAPAPAPEKASAFRRASGPGAPSLALGVSVAGDASTLPSPAVGAAASLAFTRERLRIEVDGRRWASQSGAVATADAGARFTMTSAGLRSCFRVVRAGPLDASPCAGADLAFVEAAGYGAQTNYAASARWFDAAGGALVRAKLARWLALRATLEAFVPLSRPTFVVEGQGDVHRPPVLGGAASLGAEALIL